MSGPSDQAASNVEALELIWRRSPFHDRSIESVTANNKRVLIRVENHTLIITGVTHLERCQLPSVWLYEKLTCTGGRLSLEVST